MASIISRISSELHVPEEDLVSNSVNTYLEKEMEKVEAEIEAIMKEFNVSSRKDMKKKIETGEIEEHPAWEKLIYWENLDEKVKSVRKWMQQLSTKS